MQRRRATNSCKIYCTAHHALYIREKMNKLTSVVLVVFLSSVTETVLAHSNYRREIPNGDEKIFNSFALGHKEPEGGSQINWFGMDFAANGYKWTKQLCKLDSDSDGQTNGFELGDPDCSWKVGSIPRFNFDLSHPGIKDSISIRNMTKEEIALLNSALIAHLPITPHSGWISLGYAVFLPLGIAGIISVCINHIEFVRTSYVGKMLLQDRVSQLSCCLKNRFFRKFHSRYTNSFRKRLSVESSAPSPKIANAGMARHARNCRNCCKNEFDAYPWFINLNIGELMFLLAVSSGLIALICLKQGMKHRLANTLGQLASTLCFLVVLPASRTSVWVIIFGIPFERAIKWHRLFGKLFIIAVYLHLIVVLWKYGSQVLTSQIQWGPSKDAPYPIYGLICGISITLIACTSIDSVRRKSYEIFYFSHLPLLMIISITAILHAPGSEYRGPVAVAFSLWGFDRIVGRCFLRTHKAIKTEVEAHKYKNLVKLTVTLAKPLKLGPGDYFNLYIPEIDRFENHPFTVSLQPQKNVVCFFIKTWGIYGSWVERLRKHCSRSDFDVNKDLKPILEGPYGKLSIQLNDYRKFFICCGGIGVTPMINIALELHRRVAANNYNKDAFNIFANFIWVVRDEAEFEWFSNELCSLMNAKDFFQIHLFVTGKSITSINDVECHYDQSKISDKPLGNENEVNLEIVAKDNNTYKNGDLTEDIDNSNAKSSFEALIEPLIQQGRPNFSKLFSNKHDDDDDNSFQFTSGYYTKTAVLACGPSNLVNDIQNEASKRRWPLHKETFLF